MSQWYVNPVGGSWVVTGIALVLLLVMLWISPLLRRLGPRRQGILVAIRVVIFLLIVVAMLRPTLVHTVMKRHPATMPILVDLSRSMEVTDSVGGKTRWQLLRDTLRDAQKAIAALGEETEVVYYGFSADVNRLGGDRQKLPELPQRPTGEQTAIGAALEKVLEREGRKRLLGVMLLTDGAQQAVAPNDVAPQVAVRRIADLGTPLYAVGFGQERGAAQSREVAVVDVVANTAVFVKNELTVGASVRLGGMINRKLQVELLYEIAPGKMEVVASEPVVATKDDELVSLELRYIPRTPGEHKITVRVPPQPGELVTANNQLSTFITVLEGGLNVKFFEGELRAEQVYLRRALNASPDIKVDYVWLDHRQRKNWPAKFADDFRPGKYNVYIIGDLDSTAFRPEDLLALREAVDAGAGLLLLGGFHSYWPGGYQTTELRHVMPLEAGPLDRLERQNFDEPPRADLHLPGPLKMIPDPRFGNNSVMRLAPGEANKRAWDALPPLEGANRFRALKPAAKPLAVTPQGEPLLVAMEPGEGRVLAFAGDSTWHWVMEGQDKAHKTFWRQVIMWLAKKDETSSGLVWAKLDSRRFRPGARVDFSVGARSPAGEPAPNATFQAKVILPDGKSIPVLLAKQADQVRGIFTDTFEAGDYQVEVTASDGDKPLGDARARFTVHQQDLELSNPAARPSVLASLAKMTSAAGGQAVAPEQLNDLLAEIKLRPRQSEIESEEKETPWDSPWYLLLLVSLLGAEWYLRKRWGLV